ncbi:hypothetical protein L2E82_30250 [Cichorium intybus]|uniref:Uncharacterized protein n=1 Tax=Cichorium intybus TaxID=13427 RepID=A0ACB9CZP8_CICIN|nr:hypothetical protein L2E82_30250 [Cichorium intybus]
MEGHAVWESQETTERVVNVVEEEVVGDNTTPDSTALNVSDVFENVDLVMSEPIPSPDNLVDADVVEGVVSDSIHPSPTTPEIAEVVDTIWERGVDDNITPKPKIFKNFEHFENKGLVMGDFISPPDKTSLSFLVSIHQLDDDQKDDADKLVFENNKHDFIATHDPFMNGKLDVINTIDEDIWKHLDMLPSDPIRLENSYWYCKPKLQSEDNTQYVSNKREGRIELENSKLPPSAHRKSSGDGNRAAAEGPASHSTQGSMRSRGSTKGRLRRGIAFYAPRGHRPTRCTGVDLGTHAPRSLHIRAVEIDRSDSSFIRWKSVRLELDFTADPRRAALWHDHPFLQIPDDLESSAEYTQRRDALTGCQVLEATIIDRDILRTARLWDGIEPFLHRTWSHGEATFTCRGWYSLMANQDDIV